MDEKLTRLTCDDTPDICGIMAGLLACHGLCGRQVCFLLSFIFGHFYRGRFERTIIAAWHLDRSTCGKLYDLGINQLSTCAIYFSCVTMGRRQRLCVSTSRKSCVQSRSSRANSERNGARQLNSKLLLLEHSFYCLKQFRLLQQRTRQSCVTAFHRSSVHATCTLCEQSDGQSDVSVWAAHPDFFRHTRDAS